MVGSDYGRDLATALAREIRSSASTTTDRALEISRQALVDCVGVMVAGSMERASFAAAALAPEVAGGRGATLMGRRIQSSADWAALANGVAAHVLDFDDGHGQAIAHPSAVLLPALLAVAEECETDGASLIEAHAVGVRVFGAFGSVVNPRHFSQGWHTTASIGTLAAAAGVAFLLGLDSEQIAHALGIAASQSCGIRSNFGSMTKSFHAGWAAHSGVIAARLAKAGFTSSTRAFEGPAGWLQLMTGDSSIDPWTIVDKFATNGADAALAISLKRFAACGTTHAAIEAVLQLRDSVDMDPSEIAMVECHVDPTVFTIVNPGRPRTGLEGKFNLEYCLAVAMIDGAASLDQFTDERVLDPTVRRLADRVQAFPHPEGAKASSTGSATVTITLTSGEQASRTIDHKPGIYSIQPLSLLERREKFIGCLRAAGHADDSARRLFTALEDLGQVRDLRVLTESLRAPRRPM